MGERALIGVGLALVLAGCGATGGLEHPTPRGYRPAVPVTVAYVPARALAATCGVTPERLVGCSKLWPGDRCEIIIAEGLEPKLMREVIRHEEAHCGGWVHED